MKIKVLLFGLFALSTFIIARLSHRATDGFMLGHVQTPLTFNPAWEVDADMPLAQVFHYMEKGAQTYVFFSEDGKSVLKLFKFHHLKEKEKTALFTSYALAFQKIRDQTGLSFVHLNPTSHLHQKITLVDRLGIRHELDADKTAFVVQRRAELVIPTLEKLKAHGDFQGAQEALTALLNLQKSLQKRKIYDHDAHLTKNYGFLEKTPLLLDCGNLSEDSCSQMLKAGALSSWLGKEWPELHLWFEENFL